MASTAVHIASVIYDAACRRFDAAVAFFIPGLSQPLLIPVRVEVPQSLSPPALVRHLVRAAERQIVK